MDGDGKRRFFFFLPGRGKYWIAGIAALAGVSLLLGVLFHPPPDLPRPEPGPEALPRIEAPPPAPPDRVVEGKIVKGKNLSSALRALDLPGDLVEGLCRHLNPLVNLRKIKPGDSFEVRLSPEGRFLSFTYSASPLDVYHLSLTPAGQWLARKKEIPVDKHWARISGEISTSLFAAMDQLGEKDALIMDFADIFAWEIDFYIDPQPGDRFEMVAEKYFVNGAFVKYGRILYASYQREKMKHEAAYYDPPEGRGGYFTPQGETLRKALLRSPLKFTRISSGYSRARPHPILGVNRPHLGIDYAAPSGTPVWAVADGTVSFSGWNGGYGKQVVIRHAKGYQSMYGHLSRFAPGIRKGASVRQKQVIGYVGSTGLSTGPHLDFRLQKNGVYRNPLKEISPRAASLTGEQIPEFKKALEPVFAWLADSSAPPSRKVSALSSSDLEGQSLERRE